LKLFSSSFHFSFPRELRLSCRGCSGLPSTPQCLRERTSLKPIIPFTRFRSFVEIGQNAIFPCFGSRFGWRGMVGSSPPKRTLSSLSVVDLFPPTAEAAVHTFEEYRPDVLLFSQPCPQMSRGLRPVPIERIVGHGFSGLSLPLPWIALDLAAVASQVGHCLCLVGQQNTPNSSMCVPSENVADSDAR